MDFAKLSPTSFSAGIRGELRPSVPRAIQEAALNSAFKGFSSGLPEFVKSGGNLNSKIFTKSHPKGIHLLQAAMFSGELEAFKWLVEHGAKIELVDIGGNSLIAEAIERCHLDIFRFLLQRETNITGIKDRFGVNLLIAASYRTYSESGRQIEKLIKDAFASEAQRKRDLSPEDRFFPAGSKRKLDIPTRQVPL